MHILSKKCIVCCASLFFYVPLQRKLAKPTTIVSMKAKYLFLLLCTLFTACGVSDTECAQTLISNAQTLVTNGQWRQARIVLDSVHTQYPKEIAQRRIARALEDSITYLEAQANIAYTDSVLPPLLQQADKLLNTGTLAHRIQLCKFGALQDGSIHRSEGKIPLHLAQQAGI